MHRFNPAASSIQLEETTAYSREKATFQCSCGNEKHYRFVGVEVVSRSSNAFACRVCEGKGSEHEQLMYRLLDSEPLVQHYAVEACSLSGTAQQVSGGERVAVSSSRHRWDVMLLQPPGLLIEVQGEGHESKEDTRPHNEGITVADRQSRDAALAAAATAAGYSVLWAHAGARDQQRGRHSRWKAGLRAALLHVKARKPPVLFTC